MSTSNLLIHLQGALREEDPAAINDKSVVGVALEYKRGGILAILRSAKAKGAAEAQVKLGGLGALISDNCVGRDLMASVRN